MRPIPAHRRLFLVLGGLLALSDFLDAFRVGEAMIFGFIAIELLGLGWAWWDRFGGAIGGPVVLTLAALIDLSGVLFLFDRPVGMLELAIYVYFGLLSTAVIVAAVRTAVSSRRRLGPTA